MANVRILAGVGLLAILIIGGIVAIVTEEKQTGGGGQGSYADPKAVFKNALMPAPLKPGAFDQTFEGQGTVDAYTFNPYYNSRTPWRSAGIPHAPITFRPDNPDSQDYGSQNVIKWDLEKTMHYFPYRSYNDYGMWEYM